MNPLLVRQAIEYAVLLCDKYNNRIVITINGSGGMGNSTEIRPYCEEDFRFVPDLNAIIVTRTEGKTFIDTDSIKTIHCYKQKNIGDKIMKTTKAVRLSDNLEKLIHDDSNNMLPRRHPRR